MTSINTVEEFFKQTSIKDAYNIYKQLDDQARAEVAETLDPDLFDQLRALELAEEYPDALPVTQYPDEALRTVALPYTAEEFGEELAALGQKMLQTMYRYEGIGLAANQISHLKRIIVVDTSEDKSGAMVMINPEITAYGQKMGGVEEGCLSVPVVRAKVERPVEVTCKYYTPYGEEKVIEAKDLTAICIQHEIDHLNGKMFFDNLPDFRRNEVIDKVRKIQRERERAQKKSKPSNTRKKRK